jgi:hypothetical protein
MVAILAGVALVARLAISASHLQAKVPQSQSQQLRSQEQTFTGEVTRSPDTRDRQTRFVIYDQTRKTNYFLDTTVITMRLRNMTGMTFK